MPSSISGLPSIKAQVCCYVSEREIWVGRKDGGLHIYDPFSGEKVGEVSFAPYYEKLDEINECLTCSSSCSDVKKRVKVKTDLKEVTTVDHAVKHMVVVECGWCSDRSNSEKDSPPFYSPQVWATSASGDLLCFDSLKRRLINRAKGPLDMYINPPITAYENDGSLEMSGVTRRRQCHASPGKKKIVPSLTNLMFDGMYLVVASESNSIFLVDPKVAYSPYSAIVTTRLPLLGPCDALAVMPHFLIGGDRQGRLYCFDRRSWECISMVEEQENEWKRKKAIELQECQRVSHGNLTIPCDHTHSKENEKERVAVTFSGCAVTCLLYEPIGKSIWAGRKDGYLYVYKVCKGLSPLMLAQVIDPINRLSRHVENNTYLGRKNPFSGIDQRFQRKEVTSLTALSGVVLLTTADMSLIVVNSLTGKVVSASSSPSDCIVRGITKVRQKEEALFWSYSHEGGVREWRVSGMDVAPTSSTSVSGSLSCPYLNCLPTNPKRAEERINYSFTECPKRGEKEWCHSAYPCHATLSLLPPEERLRTVLALEAMRSVTAEAQELRLELLRISDSVISKDLEIGKRKKHEEELLQENEKLKKQILDLTASQSTYQSDLSRAKAECIATKEALSQSRTLCLQLQEEKSLWTAEVSSIRIAKSYVEQQLMDAQNTVSSLRAENERLYRSIACMGGMAEKEVDVKKTIQETSEANYAALLQYKRLNRLLTSVMATMEYTIRRKEEEEKDLTSLLNAFRHHVMDHVTDPHLTALLHATIVRNPARFSYSCDSSTLAQIQDRSEPIQRFFKVLRSEDPDAYEKLLLYLQHLAIAGKAPSAVSNHSSAGNDSGTAPQDQNAEGSVDKFINLLAQATELSDEAILSFRRSVPIIFVSDASATPSSPFGSVDNSSPGPSTTTMETARKAKQEEDVTLRILRDFHSQSSLDSDEMQKQYQALEFILTTRRGLIDQLGYLYRRLQLAQMACEAIGAPTHMGISVTAPYPPFPPSQQPQNGSERNDVTGSEQKDKVGLHSQLITGISSDLLQTLRGIIIRFLTRDEQSRLHLLDHAI